MGSSAECSEVVDWAGVAKEAGMEAEARVAEVRVVEAKEEAVKVAAKVAAMVEVTEAVATEGAVMAEVTEVVTEVEARVAAVRVVVVRVAVARVAGMAEEVRVEGARAGVETVAAMVAVATAEEEMAVEVGACGTSRTAHGGGWPPKRADAASGNEEGRPHQVGVVRRRKAAAV